HLHRRARHRHGQAGLAQKRARRRRDRRDARSEAPVRSRQPPESRQSGAAAMMKTTLCVFVACGLVAGGATAQQPAPAPAPTPLPERPALKLKLEEPPARSEPRITFGPREGKGEQRPADLLPEL